MESRKNKIGPTP